MFRGQRSRPSPNPWDPPLSRLTDPPPSGPSLLPTRPLVESTRCDLPHACLYVYTCICIHVSMGDEKEGRQKQARSNKHKAKQYSTPKAVTFPKKNELPQVGLKPHDTLHDTLHSRQSALPLSYQGSTGGLAQISHLIIHLMNRLYYTCNTHAVFVHVLYTCV